jgi:glutamate dehydrogenase (NADP+)
MRFCQAFMNELHRAIGADIDVPAGDIGVGGREIGYLFGQFTKLTHSFDGAWTGKGVQWGGSLIRPEATGYGCVYFADEMLRSHGHTFEGKKVAVSGAGNVAQYAIEKVHQLGGKAITASDSEGTVVDPDGIRDEKWAFLMDLKNVRRGRLREYAEKFNCEFLPGRKPWSVPCDVALPCATQNEIDAEDAARLVKNHCLCVAEGANMPADADAVNTFLASDTLFGPGKAANAGGVATSGLEMQQNSMRRAWPRQEVDERLHAIMRSIHTACIETARDYGKPGNYVLGANTAGFTKVADSMIDQGIV